MNEPYEHDPRVAEIDAQLEALEARRQALRAEGRALMAAKADLLMHEQITLRVLNDSPLSGPEIDWIDAHPAEWAAIKEATRGKRGSRKGQRVSAK